MATETKRGLQREMAEQANVDDRHDDKVPIGGRGCGVVGFGWEVAKAELATDLAVVGLHAGEHEDQGRDDDY